MARAARKTAKPKMPSYERIDRKSDPLEVYGVLDTLVEKHRPDLEECRIALAWRFGLKRNKDGQLVLGKCKKVSDLDKQFQGFDFIIILNKEAWQELDAEQRRALVHHELTHCAISEDQNGNPKKDARGLQMYRVRKHDLEEFGEIVARYGCYMQDIENFVLAAVKSPHPPQPTLPFCEPKEPVAETPAPGAEVMPSAARKRPVPKKAAGK